MKFGMMIGWAAYNKPCSHSKAPNMKGNKLDVSDSLITHPNIGISSRWELIVKPNKAPNILVICNLTLGVDTNNYNESLEV
jgi:hypothetical protein